MLNYSRTSTSPPPRLREYLGGGSGKNVRVRGRDGDLEGTLISRHDVAVACLNSHQQGLPAQLFIQDWACQYPATGEGLIGLMVDGGETLSSILNIL